MKKTYSSCILIVLFVLCKPLISQNIPYSIDNVVLYDFIDELSNIGAIDINSTVKPYSRKEIANYLTEAKQYNALTKRQKQEIDFYLKDFNKELVIGKDFDKRFDIFYYSDSAFQLSANVIFGGRGYMNANSFEYNRWNGAEFSASINKNISFYGSLRDNYESKTMGGPEYLTNRRGGAYKAGSNFMDFNETYGGVIYTGKWATLGLLKDNIEWGTNYHGSNILSSHNPSIAHISLKLKPIKWFEYNYIHGWLASNVVDSSEIYNLYDDTRLVYQNKYIAASMFTLKPWKKLYFSFGNSIIYGDCNFNPIYLIPFLFYRSADLSYSATQHQSGQNSQMYFDISSRQINHLHLYTSVFIDEISITNMFDKQKQSNTISAKFGAKTSDVIKNTSLTFEYTISRPFVYQHSIPTLTFESNDYVMGHYLRDNADEIFFAAKYKPIRGLDILLEYTQIRKGKDYEALIEASGELTTLNGDEKKGVPFMDEVRYSKKSLKLSLLYQIINDAYIFAEYEYYDISGEDKDLYTPPVYQNNNNMLSFGLNFGF